MFFVTSFQAIDRFLGKNYVRFALELLDGSEDDLVYENSEELIDDDSFVREMFESDSESDFEGFDI